MQSDVRCDDLPQRVVAAVSELGKGQRGCSRGKGGERVGRCEGGGVPS